MIPSWWQLTLLALGTYRAWRIVGLDDAPWLVRWRNWLVGAHEVGGVWTFDRPALAGLIACPWCLGWWFALVVTAAWFLDARVTLLACVPFALATLVGALGHFLNA